MSTRKNFALLLLLAGPVFAAENAPASGAIVELPKFEVTDSRVLPPPESWRYAEVPGFEVLSGISERETKRFVHDFLLLQEVVAAIMPGLARNHPAVPTALLLCGRGKNFDQFLPDAQRGNSLRTNSLFFANSEHAAIVVDFALDELQLDNLPLDDDATQEADPYRAFYLEYFRFFVRRHAGARVPAWFEEGLVQIFAAMEFDRKSIRFAQIGDGFGGSKNGDFNRLLARHSLLPLPELFAEPPQSRDAFWSAQSYAFVHLCLYGMNFRYQKSMIQFLDRLGREPLSEALFKECFKKSYDAMNVELRGYIEFTVHTATQFKAKKGKELPNPPAVALREATPAEVGRIKGEVLRLGDHGDAAHLALIAPYVRGERDPRLLAAIGLDERFANHDARARKFLEAAVAAKVPRARAYIELARLRLAEGGDPARPLDASTRDEILAVLSAARAQPPPLVDASLLMVETWRRSADAPTVAQFAAVLDGVRAFPRELELVFVTGQLALERKFSAEARALAAHGLKSSSTPGVRAQFEALAREAETISSPAPSLSPP